MKLCMEEVQRGLWTRPRANSSLSGQMFTCPPPHSTVTSPKHKVYLMPTSSGQCCRTLLRPLDSRTEWLLGKGRYFWSSLSKVVSVKRISCATYGSITYHKMLTGNREAEVLVQRQDFWDSQVQEDMPITLGRRLHGTEREATSHV